MSSNCVETNPSDWGIIKYYHDSNQTIRIVIESNYATDSDSIPIPLLATDVFGRDEF